MLTLAFLPSNVTQSTQFSPQGNVMFLSRPIHPIVIIQCLTSIVNTERNCSKILIHTTLLTSLMGLNAKPR